MKKYLLPAFILFLFAHAAVSQITITQSDMPQAGDTLRVSTTTNNNGFPAVTYTGAGVTWDYSKLTPQSQTIDTFLSVSSTPLAYQFFFNDKFLYPDYAATVAQASASFSLYVVTVTQVINYYKASSSDYESVGYGASLDGLPTSVKDNSIDTVYRFPMDYGNSDSCNSNNGISIPGIAYFGESQKRVNHVIGWGTLITPYGSFSTLKVETILYNTDTIYIDTLGFGLNTPQTEEIQYKWLANGQHVPLLQINEDVLFGFPVYTNTVYRDSIHRNTSGINPINSLADNVNIFPNPANENATLTYSLNTGTSFRVNIYSVDGRCVEKLFEGSQPAGSHQLNINTSQLSPGVYFVTMQGDSGLVVKKLSVVR